MRCALLIVAVTVGSCASSAGPPQKAGHSLTAPTKQATPDSKEEASLPMPRGREVSFQVELERVSRLRLLPADGEIHGLIVDHDELLAHVERAVDLEVPEKALRGTEAMLVGLGVVPQDFDYRATMLRLLSAKLAGLYDPHLKTMMIRDGLAPQLRDMTLLHELVHALQDQHYQLDEVVDWHPDDTDRSGALSALAEGDATSLMCDGMMEEGKTAMDLPPGFIQERMRADQGSTEGVPPIISRSLKASYVDGLDFVHGLRRRGGWEEVNRVWKRPPATTEQILHLDKYDANDQPQDVAIPPAPSEPGWTPILHDVWGEQNVRLVFEEWLPRKEAERAASGWGGDRIVAYRHDDGRRFISWHIVGDDDDAGTRMRAAFQVGLTASPEEDGSCGRVAQDRTYWCVTGQKEHVWVVTSSLSTSRTDEDHVAAISRYFSTRAPSPASD